MTPTHGTTTRTKRIDRPRLIPRSLSQEPPTSVASPTKLGAANSVPDSSREYPKPCSKYEGNQVSTTVMSA
jgi:hypothetical protein